MEYDVVKSEVTVNNTILAVMFFTWDVGREPFDKRVHGLDGLGLSGSIRHRPSLGLTLVIVLTNFSIILKANLAEIVVM